MATIITRSDELHLGLLQSQTMEQVYKMLFFSRFAGFTKHSRARGEDIVPPSPIVIKKDFQREGSDNMTIPMLGNLTAPPVYGDKQVQETGESQALRNLKLFINQRRKAVTPPARMANQRVAKLQLVRQAKPQVETWLARDTEVQIVRAFYEGYSANVTADAADGGIGQAKRYHPNIYCADSGEVSYSGTLATHIGNIHAANNGLAAGAAEDIMSAAALYKFMSYCNKKQILPMVVGGYDIRPLLIHENQWQQLLRDKEFRETMNQAVPRSTLQNPLLNGAQCVFAKFAIFVREFSVFGLDSTSTTLTWGATYPLQGVDAYSTKGAICFGVGAIGMGWAFGPEYSTMEMDHGAKKETAVAIIDGCARADYVHEQGASPLTGMENTSSAILLTHSPDSVI